MRLGMVYRDLDISGDPYIRHLVENGEVAKLQKAIMTQKTACQEQLKSLLDTAQSIKEQLGHWACDNYLRRCMEWFRKKKEDMLLYSSLDVSLENSLEEKEANYLWNVFAESMDEDEGMIDEPVENSISLKAKMLIDSLVQEARTGFSGIVFATQRAVVCMLKKLIMAHPATRDKFTVGSSVSVSTHVQRKAQISDCLARDDDSEDIEDILDDLRAGRKNLLISTTVVEEGIDITACNTVICFDPPANLVSFMQRRGRARAEKSKYIIMSPADAAGTTVERWQALEEELKQKYMDEMRELERIEDPDSSDRMIRPFEIASTG